MTTIYKEDFYVYAFLRKDFSPYYIGKGRGDRAFSTTRTTPRPEDPSRIRIFMKNLSEPDALNWEKHWIKAFGRKDIGTGILRNYTDGGDGTSGSIHSEETKRKMSDAKKGKIMSPETRQKMSVAKKGITPSPETRQKLSDAKKGKPSGNKGKTASPETRQKISDAKKGKIMSPETRQKLSDVNKGKTASPESRQKMSDAQKGKTAWNKGKPGTMLGKKLSPESRQKISESLKLYQQKKKLLKLSI